MKRFFAGFGTALLAAVLCVQAQGLRAPRHEARTHPPAFGMPNPLAAAFGADAQHNWKVKWAVEKRWVGQAKPYEVREARGNVLCTAGVTRMLNLLVGAGGQALDNTHSRLGVGDGTTAVAAGDTDLSAAAGSTHRQFNVSDSTFPSVATNVVTFKSTFGSTDAPFHWQELGADAGTSSTTTVVAPLLNHKLSDLGTKPSSGATWALTMTITVTAIPKSLRSPSRLPGLQPSADYARAA